MAERMNVNPTRMMLTALKKRLKTAVRGHKLLKDKRDELMKEFLELARENGRLRQEVEKSLERIYRNFSVASAMMSREVMEESLMFPKQGVIGSGTGNTEAMADLVAQGVRAKGSDADLINATDFGPERLDEYDAYAFGCPAMGDEELEDTEFLPMYDAVEPLLEGKRVALFGSYDWNDGEWMELWEQRAEEAGLVVVDSAIAKDYPDDDASADCMRLGSLIAQ